MTINLKWKNILVTGASGFIGGNLTSKLVKEGANVRILVRKMDRKLLQLGKVKVFIGDLTDIDSLKNPLKGVDIVFNVAGALPYHKLSADDYFNVNVHGVENLVKQAINSKVKRFVHVSTVGIYGDVAKNISEKSKPAPTSIYAKSKFEGEKKLLNYKKAINTIIIRPTLAYGPGDTRPVFFRLFKLIGKSFFLPIGNGENYFHTVYIDNLVQALLLSATKKKAIGEDFIVGDDPCPKFKDILLEIYKLEFKKYPSIYVPKIIAYLVSFVFNFSSQVDFITQEKRYKIDKAKKILGYKAKIGLAEGFLKTYNWYKQKKLLHI